VTTMRPAPPVPLEVFPKVAEAPPPYSPHRTTIRI
jgi:hypothetical protein